MSENAGNPWFWMLEECTQDVVFGSHLHLSNDWKCTSGWDFQGRVENILKYNRTFQEIYIGSLSLRRATSEEDWKGAKVVIMPSKVLCVKLYVLQKVTSSLELILNLQLLNLLFSKALATTNLFTVSYSYPITRRSYIANIRHAAFSDWLFLLGDITLNNHPYLCSSVFLFIAYSFSLYGWIYLSLLIQSFIDE